MICIESKAWLLSEALPLNVEKTDKSSIYDNYGVNVFFIIIVISVIKWKSRFQIYKQVFNFVFFINSTQKSKSSIRCSAVGIILNAEKAKYENDFLKIR